MLAERTLTYEKALEIATGQETAAKNVQTLRGMQSPVGMLPSQRPPVEPVHLLKSGKHPVTPPEQKAKASVICYRCGGSSHKAAQCKFLKAKCHNCGKIGHLKCMCKSTKTQATVNTVGDTFTAVQEQYKLYHVEEATVPKASENPP